MEVVDIVNLYIQDIKQYDVLSDELVEKYFKRLENKEDKKLLLIDQLINDDDYKENGELRQTIEKNYYYHLNIDVLFKSLSKIKSYDKAINYLLDFYSKLSANNNNDVILLKKYLEIANFLGRPLNIKELKKYFNINEDAEILDPSTLAKEIKKYVLFKHSYNELYIHNLKLVIPFVKKYYSNKLDFLDLVNEGNLGLMQAIDKFDLSRGNKFSTCAAPWIESKIRKAINNNKEIIRIPQNVRLEMKKCKQEIDKLQQEKGISLTLNEISKELNIPIDKLRLYLQIDTTFLSLDQEVNYDSSATVMDFIPDESSFKDMYRKCLSEDIEVLYNYLKPNEIEILKMFFGIGKYQGMKYTLRDAANELNISHTWVNQMLTKAQFKLIRVSKKDEKVKALRSYLA